MREKDIKILWGRSGNRCAICKLELTPDGSRETLGEMAHIIARSSDGPRGVSQLPIEDRDCYDNLILLCPNHHSEVDKNLAVWTTERVRVSKAEHEEWVSARLGAGQITIQPVDNSAFLESRRYAWSTSARSEVAIVVSLTPLRALSETLDPLDALVVKQLESVRVPDRDRDRIGIEVNRYGTRTTPTGLVNQDSRGDNGYGHRIEIFRVGHCEYFLELGGSVRQITEVAKEKNRQLHDAQIIRYTDVAEGIELGLTWLWHVWTAILPYTYMSLTVRLINTSNTVLYSREGPRSAAHYGFIATYDHLEYSDVVQRRTDVKDVILSALSRVVNAYGLVLTRVHDETGEYVRPERMR